MSKMGSKTGLKTRIKSNRDEHRVTKWIEAWHEASENERLAQLQAALANRHYRIVAIAADFCADGLLYEQEEALKCAYRRLLEGAVKTDPRCKAKAAIARALVQLDSQDVVFFDEGCRYQQLEPSWGESVDTAIDVRCSCAMGLMGTGWQRALITVAELLADSQMQVRLGAIRAIACAEVLSAEALLRHKALSGDTEPEVIGECLAALLHVAGEDAAQDVVDFVAGFLNDPDQDLQQLAALCLGESRLPEALTPIQMRYNGLLLREGLQRSLLRAAVFHRSDASLDWLLSIAESAVLPVAIFVVEEMSIYSNRKGLCERVGDVVRGRAELTLTDRFNVLW